MKYLLKSLLSTLLFILIIPTALAGFSDIPHHHVNYDAINFVQERKIVNGYEDGTYRPNKPINRAELVKIIMEAAHPTEVSGQNCFPDVQNEWFAAYVCGAKALNIIGGYPDGTFQAGNNITFAEAAKIIVNGFGFTVTPNPDVWYKPYTDYLKNKGATPDTIDRLEKNLTRGEMAEIIYRLLKTS